MNKEISASEAAKIMNNDDVILIDVRENDELAICRINGALHIPMGQIPEHVDALPRDKQLIIFCHHGMRSLNVVQYLEARGIENAINMIGGIHAWSVDVDPEIQRY